ncbi:MAG: protein kinase [Spirochaetales bacterium]|nr:protein kinase [Spirochaetales bacterium]
MNIEKILKGNALFAYIPNDIIKSITTFFKEQKITRSLPAVQMNNPDDCFFIITSGKVKVHYIQNIDQELGVGDYFSEMVLFNQKSRVQHAFPIGDSATVLSIEKKDFVHCLDAYPLLATVITSILSQRLSSRGIAGYERTIASYTIIDEIMSQEKEISFIGEHSILKRPVMIQLIPHLFIFDPEYKQRLLNKMKVVANLPPDYIIRPTDMVQAYNTYFVVYDIEGGIPLSEIAEKTRSIPHPIISYIILETARVLSFLHSKGLIHTDIRPENIMITMNGDIRIANFGIMHPDHCIPEYMPPEQLEKKVIDRTVDIYALGVIAYLLAANRLPCESKELHTLLKLKLNREYTPLQEMNPLLPNSLLQFVSRALEPKSEKRLENCANLPELFALWLNPEKLHQKSEGKLEPTASSRESFIQWMNKKFFQPDDKNSTRSNRKKIKILGTDLMKEKKSGYESLFEQQDEFYSFKLLTFEEFVEQQIASGAKKAFLDNKGELSSYFQSLEHERQELVILHLITLSLLQAKTKKDIFSTIMQMLGLLEKSGKWVLLSKREKKIKNQAERLASGANYSLDAFSDHSIIAKAETIKKVEVFREKNSYVLLCPVYAGSKYIGCICLEDRLKPAVDSRLNFYSMFSKITPAARITI